MTSRAEHLVDPRASAPDEILRAVMMMRRRIIAAPSAAVMVMLRELAVTAADVVVAVVGRRLPLETIDVGQVGGDDVPLIEHHAQREESKEQGLDGESHEREEVGGMVDAAGAVVVGVNVSDAVDESVDDEEEGVEAGEAGVENEEEEVLVIPNSHAVIHPRAVMIHFYDASLADTAVMRPGRLERLTPPTHPPPPLWHRPRRTRTRTRGGARNGARHARGSGHSRGSRNERRSRDRRSHRSRHGDRSWHRVDVVVVVVVAVAVVRRRSPLLHEIGTG